MIAVQLDNEPSMAFQDALYFADYHPLAIDTFRAWLTDRYHADVTAWQQAWGDAAAGDFRLAEPPRPDVNLLGAEELVGCVAAPTPVSAAADRDWLTFIEDSLVEHLVALRGVHEDAGMGHLLTTVNLIPNVIHEAPLRHRRVRERLGEGVAVGVDHYYDPPMPWSLVSCLARTAAAARAAGEPLVWAPEMMAGIWRSPGEVVDYPDPTPQEQAAWWGAAMALGYRGFNFYMLVDRENWALAPISASGELTAFADPLRRLAALLSACPEVLDARPLTSVTVATYRPYLLDAHTTVGTMRQPVVPWAEPARREAYDAWDGLVSALVEHSIGYELWDTEEPAPPPGSQVLIPDGAPIPGEALDRLASSGCSVLQLRADVDFATIPGVQGVVRVVAPDPDTNVLAAVHVTDDNVHLLHLVRWGGSESASGGWLEVSTSAWAEGAWREAVDGLALQVRPEGGWFIPSFTGHMVFRWVNEAT